jgi:hypothetical protein
VPTDGVEFDAGDFVMDGSTESLEGVVTSASVAPGTDYTPPAATGNHVSTVDAELGGQPTVAPPPPSYPQAANPSILSPPPSQPQDSTTNYDEPLVSKPLAELNELD